MTTEALEVPAADQPPAFAQICPTCPPIVAGQSWMDICWCGCTRFRHKELTHKPISVAPGVTCHGQNLAGSCRRPECDCTQFRLKEKA